MKNKLIWALLLIVGGYLTDFGGFLWRLSEKALPSIAAMTTVAIGVDSENSSIATRRGPKKPQEEELLFDRWFGKGQK